MTGAKGFVGRNHCSQLHNIKDGKVLPIAETKILDTVLYVLRSEKLESFDATKQDELKEKLRSELNKALGVASVYSIYITSFILQ